jgi:hypothetical protein
MGQKKWKKPKLIILIRGTSEEHVLEMCKAQNSQPSIGVNFTFTPAADCFRPGTCEQCGTVGTS